MFWHLVARLEWRNNDGVGRRHELYARAAPIFRRHGYAGTTMKALARACELSIPALYRYFPSKKAFALFPLMALYPELHEGSPRLSTTDPASLLFQWIDNAADDMPNYVLALRLAQETGLRADERLKVQSNLAEHAQLLASIARHAAPSLDECAATDLAWAMINVAIAPALTGSEPEGARLRRQLRALLGGYGLPVKPGVFQRANANQR
jgi:AcrR family transcriptional regulator